MTTDDIDKQIAEVEEQMKAPDFWKDKEKAQAIIQEYNQLKSTKDGGKRFDKGNAVVSVLGGAGGTDAEDFARILTEMYWKFVEKNGWGYRILHENKNDHDGYRNITFEVIGRGAYGKLKNESGVHRLVRISPFNARKQRHTAFAMVEVIPDFPELKEVELKEDELEMSFAKSGGPGGQNVNKRDTAVRILHKPTKISVHVDSERSQSQNKEKATEILKGKIFKKKEDDRKKQERGMSVSTEQSAEWGNQIRSYVLHPYQMVKDHRTKVETRNVDSVFDGNLDEFVEAEKNL